MWFTVWIDGFDLYLGMLFGRSEWHNNAVTNHFLFPLYMDVVAQYDNTTNNQTSHLHCCSNGRNEPQKIDLATVLRWVESEGSPVIQPTIIGGPRCAFSQLWTAVKCHLGDNTGSLRNVPRCAKAITATLYSPTPWRTHNGQTECFIIGNCCLFAIVYCVFTMHMCSSWLFFFH